MTKVLIIDDDPDICTLLERMLEPAGYATATAHDGEAGLEAGLDDGTDLVILDVWLPKIEGIAVLKSLHETRPGLPVIMLSGGSEIVPLEHSTALAQAYGAVHVLFKPFRRTEVLETIEKALGG